MASSKFSTNANIYAFATENLKYLSSLPLRGKSILTVGSSYDSAINCALYGSQKIDNFDININSRHYSRLKHEAIKRLDYVNFLNFFMPTPFSFAPSVYNKLKEFLPLDTQEFFDNAYAKSMNENLDFSNNASFAQINPGQNLRTSSLFNTKHDTLNQKVANNPYLQSEADYIKSSQAIKDLDFSWIDCDILSLHQKLLSRPIEAKPEEEPLPITPTKYDVIILSNIAEYSHHLFLPANSLDSDYHAHQFKLKVVLPLLNHLNADGLMMLGYSFASDSIESVARNSFSSSILRRKLYANIENHEYYEIPLKSAIIKRHTKSDIIDCASILKKNKITL